MKLFSCLEFRILQPLIFFLLFVTVENQDQIPGLRDILPPSNNATTSSFGYSLSLGREDLIVGEPTANNSTGLTHIFNVVNKTKDLLPGRGPNCRWGHAVNIFQDQLMAIGAPSCNLSQGLVSIYEKTDFNGTWVQIRAFYGNNNESLGNYVSFGGNATTQYLAAAGTFTVHIYIRNGTETFTENFVLSFNGSIQSLAFSDSSLPVVDLFIGILLANSSQSHVDVYRQLFPGNWTFLQRLFFKDSNFSLFGSAIATESDSVYIGAPGIDSVFRFRFDGDRWNYSNTFQNTTQINFGASIAVFNGRKVIGAPTFSLFGNVTGAAFLFANDDTLIGILFGNNGSAFGSSVAGYGLLLAVSAPNDSTFGPESGAIYLYQIVSSAPGPSSIPINSPLIPIISSPQLFNTTFGNQTVISSISNSPESSIPDPPASNLNLGALIGGVIGVTFAIISVIVLLAILLRKKRRRRSNKVEMKSNTQTVQSTVDLIPFSELQLRGVIGQGTFGKVERGLWKNVDVAVRFCMEPGTLQEFKIAAKKLITLPPHPNVVQVYGVSIDGPQPVIVMEYCPGGVLKEKVDQTKVLDIVKGIVEGMIHLHKHNIVHGNLTAKNILLTNEGEPKLSDYGLLDFVVQKGLGPLRWMAPETLQSREFTFKSDVWMFGIVVWELLTQQEPYQEVDEIQISTMIRDSGLRPELPNQCPKVFKEIMESCWETNPKDRPTFEEIQTKLRRESVTRSVLREQ